MMYVRVNALNRIVSLQSTNSDGLIEITHQDVIENPQNYKFVEGIFIFDPQPSDYHSLNANGDWYLNNELLLNARNFMWEEIKNYRDWRLENGGYPTSVGWFHSDAASRGNYIAADRPNNRASLQALQDAGTPKMWKTMSGDWTHLTIQILNELLTSEVTQKDAHFYRAEMLKIALWMSPDPYKFSYKQNAEKNKWPVIYGE